MSGLVGRFLGTSLVFFYRAAAVSSGVPSFRVPRSWCRLAAVLTLAGGSLLHDSSLSLVFSLCPLPPARRLCVSPNITLSMMVCPLLNFYRSVGCSGLSAIRLLAHHLMCAICVDPYHAGLSIARRRQPLGIPPARHSLVTQ